MHRAGAHTPTVVSAHRREGLAWQHGKSMRARPPGPSPGHHVQHSHAHAKHHGSRVSKKMPWAPTRRFPRQLRGSSGSGEHLECPWHAQRCHLIQCAASNQDRPTPIATVNGTARSMAPPIASVTTSRTRCSSLGATSRTSSSWICSSTRERSPCSASP